MNNTKGNCNSTNIDKKSKRPYTTHSLKDDIGVTDNIKEKGVAYKNTNDTQMQKQ